MQNNGLFISPCVLTRGPLVDVFLVPGSTEILNVAVLPLFLEQKLAVGCQ